MDLLIGIPALNESATIADVVASIPRAYDGISNVRVAVVDDGSTDGTGELAANAGAEVIRHHRNQGVGVAFQSLAHHALKTRADILVTIDGDGQFNPDDIPELVAPLLNGDALMATASRFADPELLPTMPAVKVWGNRRVADLVNRLTGQNFADVSCGFRAYAREALLKLTVRHRFTYTHEVFLDLVSKRVAIVEVPLKVRGTREHGKSKVAASVVKYGLRTSAIIVRTYRDQRPLALCFAIAIPMFVAAMALLGLSFYQWLDTDRWLKWAALVGGALMGVGVATVFFGFMADIATRLRQNQEEILYWLRSSGGVETNHDDATTESPMVVRTNSRLADVAASAPPHDVHDRPSP